MGVQRQTRINGRNLFPVFKANHSTTEIRTEVMKTAIVDPRELYAKPPYSADKQEPPGLTELMRPKPDHGEATYHGNGLLEGKRALITGADSGIGRAVAIAFAREGAEVAISFLSENQDADETAQLIRQCSRTALLLPGDLADRRVCQTIAQEAVKGLGGIDILVNNAAFQRSYDEITDIPDDEFEVTFRVNVFALFYLTKALLPQMKAGGSIINSASIQTYDPSPNLIAYASSKAAIASITRSLASYAIKSGVRVNAVAPGPVWTPLIPSTLPSEKVKRFGSDTFFGRAAQPAELAPVFVFLASHLASYVTGEVYGVTGGQMPL
jgi:NAD(P)-dependent dehydrogenase (short-subunit alcohol dehydrogenase family)